VIRSFLLFVLFSAVIASPAAVLAQTPTHDSPGLPPYHADAFLGGDQLGQADATMIRPVVGLPDPGASTDRPYASPYASALGYDGRPRTAIDYRFAPDGLVGSVGYLRVGGGPRLDFHQVGMAASSRSVGLVGATLSYAFR
jgi:hypothetical protein